MIKVGIDPAFRKNGFAICILDDQKEVYFKTFKHFPNFIAWVQNDMPTNSFVCVENSNMDNVTFTPKHAKESISRFAKRCRDVGKNQAISQLTVDILKEYAQKVKEVAPSKKGQKMPLSIVNQICYTRKWKLTQKPNEDERDAFKMLLYL